ncbi:MAG: XRE family transcriptional regulator [Proteobacteria bacterium]|nr:XRE family transcriptional regulator [Pseudomonadota bacterium]
MILGSQIKAGRILLKMTQAEFAKLTKTSVDTLKRIEKSEGDYKGSAELFLTFSQLWKKEESDLKTAKVNLGLS